MMFDYKNRTGSCNLRVKEFAVLWGSCEGRLYGNNTNNGTFADAPPA